MPKLTKSQSALLAAIVSATLGDAGFQYAQPEQKDVKALAAAELIQFNHDMVNADDETEVASRATDAGIKFNAEQSGSPTDTAPKAAPAPRQSFTVVTGIEIPPAARGGRKSSEQYPFGSMEVGTSFFVPVSEQTPDPKKSLSSTVNTANSRYSEEIPGQTKVNRKGVEVPATRQLREFALREVADGAQWGEQYRGLSGAAVWRLS